MEIRSFAESIVLGKTITAKLAPVPRRMLDRHPRPAQLPSQPGRPLSLRIRPIAEVPSTPSIEGMSDPRQRARIVHAMANHELQAVELYAWALLAFPDAEADFRADLLKVLGDEQRHTRMYMSRAEALGQPFGSLPVTGYFWNKLPAMRTPLGFVCAMALTFENANLDFTLDYAAAAREAGDAATAQVIDKVHLDEQRHVAFGWKWLGRLKEEQQSMWEAFNANIDWPLRPSLARGVNFHASGREAAGLDPEFIRLLESDQSDLGREGGRRRTSDRKVGA
jgi:uncharacterized ferritin-like protein (DUF455 family)